MQKDKSLFTQLDINVDKVPIEQLLHYTAVEYFLSVEDEPSFDAANLKKVNRYLESFYHLCEAQNWDKARKLLFLQFIDTTTQEFLPVQLCTWGYYQEAAKLYKRLLYKLEPEFDILLYKQEYTEAICRLEKGLSLAQEIGTRQGESKILLNLGVASLHLKKYSDAIKYLTASLEIFKEVQDFLGLWHALVDLGDIYDEMNSYSQAFDYYIKALTITRKINDYKGEEKILTRLSSKIYLFNLIQYKIHEEQKSEEGIVLELGKICRDCGDYKTAIDINNLHLLSIQRNPFKLF